MSKRGRAADDRAGCSGRRSVPAQALLMSSPRDFCCCIKWLLTGDLLVGQHSSKKSSSFIVRFQK